MTERRSRWLLGLLLVTQLLLLGAQVPEPAGERTLLEGTLLRVVAPVAHLIEGGANLLGNTSERLTLRRNLRRENQQLRDEVAELREERIHFLGIDAELQRLRGAVDYAPAVAGNLRVADIVYADHTSWLQTIFLHAGGAPMEVNQAVVSSAGLVGRVVVVSAPYAKAQLITDRAASVGAMLERTRRQGIVRGGDAGFLELDFVPLQAEVREGDRVVSAGIDGVFPRGLPVGTVVSVEPGSELFHRIRLRPAVDFGELDQVFVLERESIPDTLKSEVAGE